MKAGRTAVFIAASSVALLIILIIQVDWILESARIKEELFNEKANMVLARTTESITADPVACGQIRKGKGEQEKHKIDSLFNHFMDFYNFHVDYSFELKRTPDPNGISNITGYPLNNQPASYQRSLDEMSIRTGWSLKLNVPDKKQFILAEMGPLFITSVVLVLVVLLLFWRTVRSLMREKRISEQTTDFLNNMTHELKTPLTNIGLAGKMLLREHGNGEKVKHFTQIILQENEKLKTQVEQVLSVSALEKDELPLQRTLVDVHELLLDCLRSFTLQLENRKGTTDLELEAERTRVTGDPAHLTHAFSNLIDNAIKYSDGIPHLTFRSSDTNAGIQLEIGDSGTGIDKAHQEKIFEKFYRIPKGDVHNVKGFGIGLAYVKKVITLHGGSIRLRSERGKGTTFIITLPNA